MVNTFGVGIFRVQEKNVRKSSVYVTNWGAKLDSNYVSNDEAGYLGLVGVAIHPKQLKKGEDDLFRSIYLFEVFKGINDIQIHTTETGI